MEYLVRWNKMKQAIMEAKSVNELKKIRNQAEAYRYALKQAGEAPIVINMACEIKLRAERRAGEFLKRMEKHPAGRFSEKNRSQAEIDTPSYKELGIDHNQADRWQKMADLPEKEFENYIQLNLLVSDGLTTAGALKILRILEGEIEETQKIELPRGKYNVIYADPPWKYDFAPTVHSRIESHYPTLTVEEIIEYRDENNKLLIDLFYKDSVLFLWATAPKLREALQVLEEWNFEYKTHMIWDKEMFGMGYWFRIQHELLLVGTMGNFSPPKASKRISSIFSAKRTTHSKKPEYIYKLIENYFPNYKYLELFATEKRKRWTSWGDKI